MRQREDGSWPTGPQNHKKRIMHLNGVLFLHLVVPSHFLLRGFHFFDAGRLAAELADVIQLRSTDSPGAYDFDLVDHLRVKGEDAFHAVTEGNLADGECRSGAAMLLSN